MNRIKCQSGTTLVMSLLLLLVVTIIALSSIRSTQMQERMSSNVQDKEASFQAAESALLTGEKWVAAQVGEPFPSTSCTMPCVRMILPDPDTIYFEDQTTSWWTTNAAAYASSLQDVATVPRYYIEYERFIPDSLVIGKGVPTGTHYYRVTARGTGNTDNSQSLIQTTYSRRY